MTTHRHWSLQEGAQIAVVGGPSSLGDWKLHQAVLMTPAGDTSEWAIQASADAGFKNAGYMPKISHLSFRVQVSFIP